MILGAIESATPAHVSGWIHSPHADLRDTLVLAFLDGACVGTGRVEIPRPDLAEAGLLDGRLGFHFPIAVPRPADAARVVVRPETSEAVLLPRDAVVAVSREAPRWAPLPDAAQLDWLRAAGALDEAAALLGHALLGLGAATLTLPQPLDRPAGAIAPVLERLMLRRVGVREVALDVTEPLAPQVAAAMEGTALPLCALHASRRVGIQVCEWAQEDGPPAEGLAALVDYPLDHRRHLLLHRATPISLRPQRDPLAITLLVPEAVGEAEAP